MTVLFLFFAALTWNACSKDNSFEKSNRPVDNPLLPPDSTENPGDSSGEGEGEEPPAQAPPGDDTTTSVDIVFVEKATVINRAQINNATLAKDRGTAQSVRDFATALNTRFTQAQSEMDDVGAQLDASVPGQTDAAHQAVTNSLMNMEGSTFDISYIDYQILELQTAIDLYRALIADGSDSRVKAYAQKYLPYLEQFLQTASTIRQTL